ncbi:MAG: tetratricopeptide repeat-containing sensor histidine kinase [Cyclobacteriaceae bacterium]|nr:tetratricopeptide repeat-containing sensor histidine kinase [Cyclobacteriaceae bacterium HetDA_MAG_MS6]
MKAYILIGFLLSTTFGFSQSQNRFDSLTMRYNSGRLDDKDKIAVLRKIAFMEKDPELKLKYSEELIELSNKFHDKSSLYKGYYQKGAALRLKGDLDEAIESYFICLELAQKLENQTSVGDSFLALGDVYNINGNHRNSKLYYNKAISILRATKDSVSLAAVLLNAGDEYFNANKMDTALIYFLEAQEICKLKNLKSYSAYNLGNIGLVYASQGKHMLAEKNINEAIEVLQELGDLYPIAVYLTYMADIYVERGDLSRALTYAHQSLQIGEDKGLKEQVRDGSKKLAQLYQKKEDFESAFLYQSQYIAYRDSINSEETIQKMADLRTEYEVAQKQAEVDLLEVQKRNQRLLVIGLAVFGFLTAIILAIIYRNNQQKHRINLILENQKIELESLNQTKDRFFSIISHDLRGPISAFHGISRMIKFLVTTKKTDDLLSLAEDIDQSVDRLSDLLDNLLTWAMQQQGHFPNVPEKVNLNELSEELVKTLANMAEGKSIMLQSQMDGDIDLWVDRNTTMTIIRNLVNNALKFTPEGGTVEVMGQVADGKAVVVVKDTGVGMPADKLDNLFKLQDKKSTYGTSGEKGLGLGLQLVYDFVQMNDGDIMVESEEGKGTAFEITLPLFNAQVTPVQEAVSAS